MLAVFVSFKCFDAALGGRQRIYTPASEVIPCRSVLVKGYFYSVSAQAVKFFVVVAQFNPSR